MTARAIRCAISIAEAAQRSGIGIRTGLHTGECDVLGDSLSGFAVDLAHGVAGLSGSGQILVSRTVKDLVAGSGLSFTEFGVQTFPGVEGQWRLFSVEF